MLTRTPSATPRARPGPAQRGSEARRDGRGRAPQPDGVGTPLLGERLDDQRQGRRDQQRRAERLHDPGGDQELDGRGGRAQGGRHGEQRDAGDERAAPAQQVGQPAADDQERGEDDVVGVEHPGQAADRRVGERLPDRGERDVDDGRVEEREERAEGRHQQDPRRWHARTAASCMAQAPLPRPSRPTLRGSVAQPGRTRALGGLVSVRRTLTCHGAGTSLSKTLSGSSGRTTP